MVVRKILEATLVAGSTSVTFTDTDIPNSLLRVYCSKSALFPISQTLSGNSVTVTYKPQDSNIGVALEIVKSGLDIVDDLLTDDSTKALSANQGYVLKGLIDDIVIPTVPENITDLDDVSVTSIQNGQVLAWNSTSEKFENVTPSSGGSIIYSETEQVIGQWTDGSTLYEKTLILPVTTALPAGDHYFYGFTNEQIKNIRGVAIYDNADVVMLPYCSGSSTFVLTVNNLNQLRGIIRNDTWGVGYVFYITVQYTKSS